MGKLAEGGNQEQTSLWVRCSYIINKSALGNRCYFYIPNSERLKKVVIENKDFESLIRNYDRPNAFFYCDPPYFKTEHYYDAAFSEADHKRLKQCLSSIKGRLILFYNDSEFIRELYTMTLKYAP